MFFCENDLDIVGFSISKRIVQVSDFAVEGGAPHEQGENNVISDQNIFLTENSFSSSLKNRESQCIISTADQNIFLAEKDFSDFPPVHQGVISGGDCLWPLNIQTN